METGYKLSDKEHTQTYSWGAGCSAWILQHSESVIVKEELMPPDSREQLHYHHQVEQFFYMLEGEGCFLIDGRQVVVPQGNGISINKGTKHLIANTTRSVVRFLVISAPGIPDDRTNL